MNKPKVAIVCPIYNEERSLKINVSALIEYGKTHLEEKYDWYICIVDNASKDKSLEICGELKEIYTDKFQFIHLPQKGKGLAVRTAWMELDYDLSIYMDIDLSTDIGAITTCLDMLQNGNDLVVASRNAGGSEVIGRTLLRNITSHIYILIAKTMAGIPQISDFQCGFKGIKKQVAINVLPSITDNTWYFDSELIVNTHNLGYAVNELPVKWTDDIISTVHVQKVTQVLLTGLYRNLSEKSWMDGIPHESGKVIDKTFFDNFVEFIKFMLVGGTSFAIDLVVALIFQYFAQDYLGTLNIFGNSLIIKDIYIAVILGFLVSVPFNFFLNRYFTFQKKETSIWIHLSKFAPVLIFGLLIKIASAYVWTDILRFYASLAIPFSSIVMLLSNYIGHKYFTFKD